MTENEQKEQISVAYAHAVAAAAGYSCILNNPDIDSVDRTIAATGMLHQQSLVCSPRIDLQLKATSQEVLKEQHLAIRLSRKNYDDLRVPVCHVPRLLVVLHLPADPTKWVEQTESQMLIRHCAFWHSLRGMPAVSAGKITVHVPRDNLFTVETLRRLMERVSRKEAL